MDDTISRQAAIDVLDEQIEQCNKSLSSFDISMKDEYAVKVERASLVAFREILEYLPPAQLGTNLAEVGTDCISRQAAIDALGEYLIGKKCPDDGTLTARLIENNVINKLPPAEPKRGRWQEITESDCSGYDPVLAGYDDLVVGYVCSACHEGYKKEVMDDVAWNYCPNCGARMEM